MAVDTLPWFQLNKHWKDYSLNQGLNVDFKITTSTIFLFAYSNFIEILISPISANLMHLNFYRIERYVLVDSVYSGLCNKEKIHISKNNKNVL